MQSKATTVAEYLAGLPPDRRTAIEALRKVILANLDAGYEEGMQYGMIGYSVPHRVYPPGYHCDPKQPLPFAALASQKNHIGIYMMCLYSEALEGWFSEAWKKGGHKLNMGKCCVRVRKLEDVPLEVLGEAIRRVPAQAYIKHYEAIRNGSEGYTGKAATKSKPIAKTKAPAKVKVPLKKAPESGRTRK